jgi:hypothetical protein
MDFGSSSESAPSQIVENYEPDKCFVVGANLQSICVPNDFVLGRGCAEVVANQFHWNHGCSKSLQEKTIMKQGVRNLRTLVAVLALFSLWTMVPSVLFAQTALSGAVSGSIVDQTGAVVKGAKVTLTETATDVSRTAMTDAAGRYFFSTIPPGEYALKAEAKGFRTSVTTKLIVEVTKTATADVKLEIGASSEVVEVTASSTTQLQTQDASVGEVLSGTELNRMPVLGRSAAELVFLQPGVEPDVPMANGSDAGEDGDIAGGQMAGARSEQVTFNIDGGDATSDLEGSNAYNTPDRESGAISPVVPVPQDSVDEFRVTTNNSNSTFSKSSGGQISIVTNTGTNAFHGKAYEYHDDNGLNANGWTNNLDDIAKPVSVDNRFGAALGGPIIKDKAFFYAFYEGRRFHDSAILSRLVPTPSLQAGYLTFTDCAAGFTGTTCNGGNNIQYNLNPANGALASNCGPSGTAACDPRSIGVSPVVMAQLALYPAGNNNTLGDGLNSIGFTHDYSTPISTEVGKLKLNYNLNNKWSLLGTWQYASTSRTGTEQVSLLGNPSSVSGDPYFSNFYTFQLSGQISPNFLSVTHGSFLKNWWGWTRQAPAPLVPGTDAALEFAGEGLGNSTSLSKIISDPININTQQARARVWDGHDWYIAQDFTYVHHSHTFQMGGGGYIWHDYHFRTDDILGGLTSAPSYYLGVAGLDSLDGYANVGSSWEPPACSPTGPTTNCLQVANGAATTWDSAYSSILGMVDHSAQVVTNNGAFQPNPLGTGLFDHVTIPSFTAYFQDVWKVRSNLTVTAGVNWGVQLVPSEQAGKETVLTYTDSGAPVDFQNYLENRRNILGSGGYYNPSWSFTPVGSLATPFHNIMRVTNWHDIGPRVALAWDIPGGNRLFGNHQTVLRGGYALVFDRTSAVSEALTPLLAGGIADVDECTAPTFVGASGGVAVCGGTSSDPTTAFRIGTDGASVPVPAPVGLPIPWTPPSPFGLIVAAPLDPFSVPAHTHQVDFTVQRALEHNLFLEVGYIGHFGRNLPQGQSLGVPYYKEKDAASGQTYAQAFDAVATQLRNGVPAASVTPQPFFENQMGPSGPAVCTPSTTPSPTSCSAVLAANAGGSMINGDIESTNDFALNFLTPVPLDNIQTEEFSGITDKGYSNYNAGFVTFRQAMTHGAQFQMDYTWGHAIGNGGTNQQYLVSSNSPYNINIDKASETFDHRQTFHAFGYYELPFGKGKAYLNNGVADRIVGGWHTAGIFTLYTGAPVCVLADGDWGSFFNETCATPSGAFPSYSPHNGVVGPGGFGVVNAFANPAAVLGSLSHPLFSGVERNDADPLRAFRYWNFDFSLGKNVAVTERFKIVATADVFNLFNHVILQNPSAAGNLDLGNGAAFGVITAQQNGARQMQLGLRLEF